jgi:predicted MFS family arabinose efflux permease
VLLLASWRTCRALDAPLRSRVATPTGWAAVLAPFRGRPDLRLVLAQGFAFGFMQNTVFACLVVTLEHRGGLSLGQAGLAYALMSVSGALARVGWGWCVDRHHNARQILCGIAASSALATATLFVAAPALPFPLILLLCAIVGATASGWNGIFLADATRRAPSAHVSSLSGTLIATNFAGNFVGPVVYGMLAAHTHHPVTALAPALTLSCWAALSLYRAGRGP